MAERGRRSLDEIRAHLTARLERAIADGVFPGAQWAFVTPEGRAEGCLGEQWPSGPPVGPETLYDLASLTKILSTTRLCSAAVDAGLVELGAPVCEYLPWFSNRAITIQHLLRHTSGLPPYLEDLQTVEGLREGISSCQKIATPDVETVYSCLGFISLGWVLETVFGERLDVSFDRLCGGDDLGFLPVDALRCAPTEPGLQGVVHDPAARVLGGVSGNAGLFGTASAVLDWVLGPWAEGYHWAGIDSRGVDWTRTSLWTEADKFTGGRPLGFNVLLMDDFGGEKLGLIGHTGFTGTCVWWSAENGICLVLLANRTYSSGSISDMQAVRADAVCVLADCKVKHR